MLSDIVVLYFFLFGSASMSISDLIRNEKQVSGSIAENGMYSEPGGARVMRAKAYLVAEILCSFSKELSRFIKVGIPFTNMYPLY